jgi:uncharacterized membrane protein
MAIGALLAIVWIVLGFWPALFVAVAIAIGAVVGRVVEGRLDVGEVVAAFRGRRSSS